MKRMVQGWVAALRALLVREPQERARARAEIDRLFRERPELLRGTSLRPEHRGRTQLLEVQDGGAVILFGIVRHPRPYAFSRQSHQVLEMWRFSPAEGRLERVRGIDLSVRGGDDGEPPLV